MATLLRVFGSAVAGAVLALVVLPAPAAAVTLVPSSALWEIKEGPAQEVTILSGTIEVIGYETGIPAGATVAGSIGPNDLTIVFRVSVDPQWQLSITALTPKITPFTALTGVGSLPGPDEDVEPGPSFPDNLDPGETSDPFFLSFSALSPGDTIAFEYA